jgi:hypothetical protein
MIRFGFITANPLPSFEDGDVGSSPIPANYTQIFWNVTTPVYLQSEIMNVTFLQDIALINATYTFKNASPNATQLLIILPFYKIPTNINLTRSGQNVSYIERDDHDLKVPVDTSLTGVIGVWPDHVIQFQLSFMGGEQITLSTTYERQFSFRNKYKINNYYYNEFRYIIGTTRWWNHKIDNAHFEFRIKGNEYDKGGINSSNDFSYPRGSQTNYQLTNEPEFFVLSTTYTDWIPEEDVFLIVYWMKRRSGSIISFPAFSFFLGIVLISFLKDRKSI